MNTNLISGNLVIYTPDTTNAVKTGRSYSRIFSHLCSSNVMFVHGFMHKRFSSTVGGSKTPNDGLATVIELYEEEEER